MRVFAELLDRLAFSPSRNAKLRLMQDYFHAVPDPERGWGLAILSGGLDLKLQVRKAITDLMAPRVDPELFRLSRDYVGDTAETVALLWPRSDAASEPPSLAEVVAELDGADAARLAMLLERWLDRLDSTGRWALLKLVTGGLRVGVSARLAKTAAANLKPVDVAEVEELWHGMAAPYRELFAWLEEGGEKPDISDRLVFRPLMLSHPLEDGDLGKLQPQEFSAEWKWDGIRVQLASKAGETRLFSRTGDDVSGAFPEFAEEHWGDVVLDGELLVVRDGVLAPFNDLQQRLNRKTVSKKMRADFPAHIRLYDILSSSGEDLRSLTLEGRRRRLDEWYRDHAPRRADLSATIEFDGFDTLESIWSTTRENGIEGLMLKRRESPYIAGRPKGHWYKWKRAPLTVDAVLMYAQRGSGKRSSYYSDFTFGTWRDAAEEGLALVPVGKAYFGFTDEELLALDKWVRSNTTERFGPVRAVTPALVLEVAFDSVHTSKRHKSGVAMRFPRIHRIRWDKPANEADRLETLEAMIEG
jgi:DNA ligase-1